MTIKNWLQDIIQTEKPSTSIVAYNFGIFETERGYTLYLIGSEEFDDDDSDWATNEDFTPKEKYLNLLQEEFRGLEWKQALDKVEKQIRDFLNSEENKGSFLAKAQAVTTGFDDGDLVRVK